MNPQTVVVKVVDLDRARLEPTAKRCGVVLVVRPVQFSTDEKFDSREMVSTKYGIEDWHADGVGKTTAREKSEGAGNLHGCKQQNRC